MKNEGVKPFMTTLSEALYCYAKAGMTQKAEDVLRRMIDQREDGNREHVNLIGQGVQNILFAYRRIIVSNEANKAKAVESAEWLFTGIGESDIFQEEDVSKCIAP
jgi:pentatricopeptide repeat protein